MSKGPIYKGKLAEPLPARPLLIEENYESREAEFNRELSDRVDLLFKFYNIDPLKPSKWKDLSFALMRSHVPGFQEYLTKTDVDRFLKIIFNVEYLRRKHKLAINQACLELSKVSPNLGDHEAIRSIYREAKKHGGKSSLIDLIDSVTRNFHESSAISVLEDSLIKEVRDIKVIKKTPRGRRTKCLTSAPVGEN